jgi:glycosyltransferase involved in cell wall biosynthesis
VLATVWSSLQDAPCHVLPECLYTSTVGGNFAVTAFRSLGLHRWRCSPGLFSWLARRMTDFDIVHLHSLYSFPVLMGASLARLNHLPYVLTTHGVLAPVQREKGRKKKVVYDSLFARRILNHASAIVYSSQQEYQDAFPLEIRAPARIIPNGIGLDQFAKMPPKGRFRDKYLKGHQGPLILYLGRLNPKKGLDLLIPAFTQVLHKEARAHLALVGVGDPPAYGQLVRKWIAEQDIAKEVTMTGILSGNDRLSAFVDADVFVLPSRSENFATALIEAMACGLPVVVSSGVNLSSEIGRASAGVVVDFDVEQLASAILGLLSSPSRRWDMREKAHKLAENYTCDKTAARLVALYQQILRNGKTIV